MRKFLYLLIMLCCCFNIFAEISYTEAKQIKNIKDMLRTKNKEVFSYTRSEPYFSDLFESNEIIQILQKRAINEPYSEIGSQALCTLIEMGNTESNIAAVDVIKSKIFNPKIKDSEIESIIYYDATDCGMRMLSLLNSTNITNSTRFKKNKLLQQYSKDSIESLSASVNAHVEVLQSLLDEYQKDSCQNMFVWETFRILADKVTVESFNHYNYTDETFEPMALPKLTVNDYSIYYQYYDFNNRIKQSGIVSVVPTSKKDYPIVNTNSLAFGEIPDEPPHKGCVFHLSPDDMKVLKDAYRQTQKIKK